MILRTTVLKDATQTALTSCGQGTVYDMGGVPVGQKVYAALHQISCSTGGAVFRVLSYSSSGFTGGGTTRFNFTSCAGRFAQWQTPLTTANFTSTDAARYWRVTWEMTTSGESYLALPFIGIQ